jgi:hypothetical protein
MIACARSCSERQRHRPRSNSLGVGRRDANTPVAASFDRLCATRGCASFRSAQAYANCVFAKKAAPLVGRRSLRTKGHFPHRSWLIGCAQRTAAQSRSGHGHLDDRAPSNGGSQVRPAQPISPASTSAAQGSRPDADAASWSPASARPGTAGRCRSAGRCRRKAPGAAPPAAARRRQIRSGRQAHRHGRQVAASRPPHPSAAAAGKTGTVATPDAFSVTTHPPRTASLPPPIPAAPAGGPAAPAAPQVARKGASAAPSDLGAVPVIAPASCAPPRGASTAPVGRGGVAGAAADWVCAEAAFCRARPLSGSLPAHPPISHYR